MLGGVIKNGIPALMVGTGPDGWFGPWIAGVLVEEAGLLPLAGWALVTGGICLALVTGALRRFESGQTGAISPENPNSGPPIPTPE